MTRAYDEEVDRLAARIRHAEPRLDDLTRQRVLGRIHNDVQVDPARPARHARRTRGAALAAACIVLLGGLWLMSLPSGERRNASRDLGATSRRAAGPALVPYLVAGTAQASAHALLGAETAMVTLDEGETLLAGLGAKLRLCLRGPAVLRVQQSSSRQIELVLEQGTLLGDYDHTQGGQLTVHSPGADTEIVGTLFAIRVHRERSEVAVANGKVRVSADGQTYVVGRSQAWRSRERSVGKMGEDVQAQLEVFDRSVRPPPERHGMLGLTGTHMRAELDGRVLAHTPLWALLPTGSPTISLYDTQGRGRKLATHVGFRRTTQVELPAPELGDAPTATAREDAAGAQARGEGAARTRTRAKAMMDRPRIAAASARTAGTAPPSKGGSPLLGDTHPPTDPDALFAEAEAAMRRGDSAHAAEQLRSLVRAWPESAQTDLALYELARLAFARSDYGESAVWIERLRRETVRPALDEPTQYLRCRVAYERHRSEAAARCFESFRARFPRSPHDEELLALLARTRVDTQGCDARPLLLQYLERYPRGRYANEVRSRLAPCENH